MWGSFFQMFGPDGNPISNHELQPLVEDEDEDNNSYNSDNSTGAGGIGESSMIYVEEEEQHNNNKKKKKRTKKLGFERYKYNLEQSKRHKKKLGHFPSWGSYDDTSSGALGEEDEGDVWSKFFNQFHSDSSSRLVPGSSQGGTGPVLSTTQAQQKATGADLSSSWLPRSLQLGGGKRRNYDDDVELGCFRRITKRLCGDRSNCCSLTRKQRILGFSMCFILGCFCSLLSSFYVVSIATKPAAFSFLFTIGNAISLIGASFLVGPWKQIKQMFHIERIVPTILFLLTMALTFYSAFHLKRPSATLVSLCLQCFFFAWYSLTYIPYGNTLVKRTCHAIFCW